MTREGSVATDPVGNTDLTVDRPHTNHQKGTGWEDVLGTKIAGHELGAIIGIGGMGAVVEAYHSELDRLVAIKFLSPALASDERARDLFCREAKAVARLSHPNIVAIHMVGEAAGVPFFSMDLIEGKTLAALALRSDHEVATVFMQIVRAIAYAHGQGVLHRDIKPSNVMVDDAGQPRVLDFGFAMCDGKDHTQSSIVGTPTYMSPEQADGQEVDARSDVYSLGATLYFLLTGNPPFQGGTPLEIMHQVIAGDLVAPRQVRPAIARDLETICLKCMAKDPGRRYQTATELAEDLQRFLTGKPVLARPVGTLERVAKWARRHPTVASLSGVVALLVTILMIGVSSWSIWAQHAYETEQVAHTRTSRALLETQEGLYNQRIASSHQAWMAGDVLGARQVLAKCQSRWRGWEWRYLQALYSQQLSSVATDWRPQRAIFSNDANLVLLSLQHQTVVLNRASGIRTPLVMSDQGGDLIAAAVTGHDFDFVTADATQVRLWHKDGTMMRSFGHTSVPTCIAVSPRLPFIGVGFMDDTLTLYNWETAVAHQITGSSQVTALAFNASSQLAVADATGQVRIWNPTATSGALITFPVLDTPIEGLSFSQDGTLLACTGVHEVVVRDMRASRTLFRLVTESASVGAVGFTADGSLLAVVVGSHIQLHSVAEGGRLLSTLRGHTQPICGFCFSSDDQQIVTTDRGGVIATWRVSQNAGSAPVAYEVADVPLTGVAGLVYTSQSGPVVTGQYQQEAATYAVVDKQLYRWSGTTGVLTAVTVSSDEALVASGSEAGEVIVRYSASGVIRCHFQVSQPVLALALSQTGSTLAIATAELIILGNTATGQQQRSWKPSATASAMVWANDSIIVGCDDGSLHCFDQLGNSTSTLLGHTGPVHGLAYSTDTQRLFSSSVDGQIIVWSDDEPILTIRDHPGAMLGIAFGDDQLYSLGTDGTIRVR